MGRKSALSYICEAIILWFVEKLFHYATAFPGKHRKLCAFNVAGRYIQQNGLAEMSCQLSIKGLNLPK